LFGLAYLQIGKAANLVVIWLGRPSMLRERAVARFEAECRIMIGDCLFIVALNVMEDAAISVIVPIRFQIDHAARVGDGEIQLAFGALQD
jgi:hypothetical protein